MQSFKKKIFDCLGEIDLTTYIKYFSLKNTLSVDTMGVYINNIFHSDQIIQDDQLMSIVSCAGSKQRGVLVGTRVSNYLKCLRALDLKSTSTQRAQQNIFSLFDMKCNEFSVLCTPHFFWSSLLVLMCLNTSSLMTCNISRLVCGVGLPCCDKTQYLVFSVKSKTPCVLLGKSNKHVNMSLYRIF